MFEEYGEPGQLNRTDAELSESTAVTTNDTSTGSGVNDAENMTTEAE